MTERNPVRDAVRYALTAGVAASFVGAPAATLAQDDVAVQDKVTVTGSRIKRVDIEGPAPVTVISREDIDASGEISVSEVLRNGSFNTFGSFVQQSGTSAGSQAAVSLRGLGSQRTLVLLDGRRITRSPTLGAAANLATIPLAAVERIEVLRDGASAIYGSDAVGGVVNIILRKDYEGAHLSYGIGRPTQSGGDEDSANIVGGVSGAKGNITFGFDWNKKQILFQGDRSFSATGLSAYGFPGSYFAYLTADDDNNPTGEFLSVGTFADPRCPAALGSDPVYTESVEVPYGPDTPNQGLCRFNYAATAAQQAASDTKSMFINSNYDINESTTFFTRGTFSHGESFGRYAPTPFTDLPYWTQGNVNNPTNPANPVSAENGQPFLGQSIDVDTTGDGTADTTVNGPFDVTGYYRNVPGGFRDTNFEDTLVDYMAGVQGTVDLLGGMDWELAGQWSKSWTNQESSGLGLAPFLQQSIDSGELDIYAVNTPWGPDQAQVQRAAAATSTQNNDSRMVSFDGSVTFDAFQLNNGPVPVALGFEYVDNDFNQDYDEQANANNFQGTAGAQDVSGARTVKSLFAETTIPVLSMLDINLAARYDDYNDFGTTINPKISAAFRPLDSLLLRATWGQGFRAPSMTELYTSPAQSFNGGVDRRRCAQDPAGDPNTGRPTVDPNSLPQGNPCRLTQYQNLQGGNKELSAEESDTWNVGLVWNPLDDLSIALDYYNIEITDQIQFISMQQIFDSEFAEDPSNPAGGGTIVNEEQKWAITRRANGRVDFIERPYANVASSKTDGIDIDASYGFSVGAIGDFRVGVNWTYVNEYEVDQGDGRGHTDPDFLDPEHRGTANLNWALGDFSANILYNYIASASVDSGDYAVDDFSTVDASVSYATPWNGLVTIGARNVFDEDPPTTANIGSPFYSFNLHDVYGRVPYIRYEQDL